MTRSWPQTFVLGAMLVAAFLAGQFTTHGAAAIEAQGGRGPVQAPPLPKPSTGTEAATAPLVYGGDSGQSAGGNGFLAVTGSYGVGTSVLYLVDTNRQQIAVYEARGGSNEQCRLMFVGARRIDLDLQLEGYHDRSEYEYRDLKRLFEKRGEKPEVGTGLQPSNERK